MNLFVDARVVPVIDVLRRKFPGRWKYNRRRNTWHHEDGWHVYTCAMSSARYDGDDSYTTHYRRSDTGEIVFL